MSAGRVLALLAIVAASLAGCGVIGDGPQAGCSSMGVSAQRCEAMVAEARGQLGEHPPVVGIVVIPVLQDEKTTLRAQNLFVNVRFTYVDGTSDTVPVFCGAARLSRPACTDRPLPAG
jgi:hypothetical protein